MRILHTMLRVGDLDRSVRFYTEVLGMKLLRTTDRPEQKYKLAFVGYDSEERSAVLELTYNYRSEEHTSELQSRGHLVCRLLLEKKNCRASYRAPCGGGRACRGTPVDGRA